MEIIYTIKNLISFEGLKIRKMQNCNSKWEMQLDNLEKKEKYNITDIFYQFINFIVKINSCQCHGSPRLKISVYARDILTDLRTFKKITKIIKLGASKNGAIIV
jgi:hypothetical protein